MEVGRALSFSSAYQADTGPTLFFWVIVLLMVVGFALAIFRLKSFRQQWCIWRDLEKASVLRTKRESRCLKVLIHLHKEHRTFSLAKVDGSMVTI